MGEIVTVNFRGDELYGFRQDDGVFLALKPVVEAMGLTWEPQRQRIQRDPILSEGTSMRLRLVTETRQSFDTYAAREMWFKQGLPVVPAMLKATQPELFSYNAIRHPDRDAAAA